MSSWIQTLKLISSQNTFLKESEILYHLPIPHHNDWDNFMRGKTCPVLDNGEHGVYQWDLEQFLFKFYEQRKV
jgi:hypothetical protein